MKQDKQEKQKLRIRRCETARMWMVLLAAALLLGGYVTDVLPVMYACVLPLLAAAALTYAIKYLERRTSDDELL